MFGLTNFKISAEAVGGAAQAEIFSHVSKLRDAGIISMLVWFSTRFTRLVEEKMNSSDIAEPSIDKTTLSMMGKLVRAAILITGFLLVMQAFGIGLEHDNYRRFRIAGGQQYKPCVYAIETDASNASYFFAAAAITGGRVRINNITVDSAQADIRFDCLSP